MKEELPEGWVAVPLSKLVEPGALIQYGILQPGPDVEGGIPYIRPTEIIDDRVDISALRRTSPEIAQAYSRSSLLGGDVILSIVGSIGKVAIVPPELRGANITQSSARLRPRTGVLSSSYLAWLLRSPIARDLFKEAQLGTGVPRLNIGDIRAMRLPLAPASEQQRIVNKVECLLEEAERAKVRLDRVTKLLKRFRQSVLAAACSGELTADWRESNKLSLTSRLDELRKARRQLWERRKEEFSLRVRDYPEPHSPGTNEELPEGWEWGTVSLLSFQDIGFAFKSSEFASSGIRLLRGENVEPGRLRWTDTRYWPEDKVDVRRHIFLQEGDIILAMDRPIVSAGLKLARVKRADLPALLVQRVMRFRLVDQKDTDYLSYCLQGKKFIDFLAHEGMTGSDLPHITGTGVAEFPVPLPPVEERDEIVRRVDGLLGLADTIERRVALAAARADKLPQSILAKAFSGELVPTEAELARAEGRPYESAETLLRRLTPSPDSAPPKRGRTPRKKS